MDKSIGVTRTQLGICVVSVVLAIPSLSTLIATSSAEGVVRQPELINFQSDHLDPQGIYLEAAGSWSVSSDPLESRKREAPRRR
jgi:hypothetical protein